MLKPSILKAKIKRSNTNLKNTVLWDNSGSNSDTNSLLELFLDNDEEIILHYTKSKDYKWILTNSRLIFPKQMKQIFLSELKDVAFEAIKNNPSQKMSNNELTLFTTEGNFTLLVEEETWHLLYEVFKFIIINTQQKVKS